MTDEAPRETGLPEGFRLTEPHHPECFTARRGGEFVVYDGSVHGLNKNGTGRGSTLWHAFRCNDLKCESRMLVRWDVLMKFVSGGRS